MSRVVLIGNCPPPWGGIARHVEDVRDLLVRARVPHAVIDLEPSHRRTGRPGRGAAAAGSRNTVVKHPASRAELVAEVVASGLRGDLLHLHTNGHNLPSWVLTALTALARTRRGPRHLVTLHSGLCPGFLRDGAAVGRLLARLSGQLLARIICVNTEIAAELRALGVAPDRLLVLPAFSPRSIRARKRPVPAALLSLAGRRLVGAALGRGPEYGADLLADALREALREPDLDDVALCLFGEGASGPELSRRLNEAGLSGRTLLLGELGHGEALGVLERLDVFVRPTRADGDSVTVREALALGRPTVATAVGHRPAGAVLVPPEDPRALARAVVAQLRQPRRPPGLQASADSLPALLSLYRELLPRSPAGHPGREPGAATRAIDGAPPAA